jgi:glutamate formiminotransferase
MAHPGVHVRFGAFDVIVQVISEELNVRDCCRSPLGVGEMTRGDNERDIANIFSISQTRNVTDLEWWIAI